MIHPSYNNLKTKAQEYLLHNGFSLVDENKINGIITFTQNNKCFISVVNQGYDLPEVYIGKGTNLNQMIRFGFILELYLNNNTKLIEKYNLNNGLNDFQYEIEFLDLYKEPILAIDPFPEAYKVWSQENMKLIAKTAEQLNQ